MSKKRRYFDDLPGVKAPRANFNLSHRVVTTMKPGLLHPIKVVEVLPGDTWTVDSAQLVKLVTPFVRPIMDDVYLDIYSFFVPLRLCYDRLEDVFGDSAPSAYESSDLAVIPSFSITKDASGSTSNLPPSGSVYDYLGAITDSEKPVKSLVITALNHKGKTGGNHIIASRKRRTVTTGKLIINNINIIVHKEIPPLIR
jgi:hypothetical protein